MRVIDQSEETVQKIDAELLKQYSDEELIAQFLETHRRLVFSVIYDRYNQLIFMKCKSIVKSDQQAKDLCHDSFMKIYTKINQFEGRSNFSLWVHTITTNECLQSLRKTKKDVLQNSQEIESTEIPESKNEHNMLENMRAQELQLLMQMLKPEQRLMMIMKYAEGLSIKEMASILDISESAVKMRLNRTRNKLSELYKSTYSHG